MGGRQDFAYRPYFTDSCLRGLKWQVPKYYLKVIFLLFPESKLFVGV
jgi:hypothetical protein